MSDESSPQTAIVKFLHSLETHEAPKFTDDEIIILKQLATYWLGIQVVGKLAGFGSRILQWLGWFVGLYLAWKSGILPSWLTSWMTGGGK